MKNTTRAAFNAYTAQIATLNGVPSVATSFAVEPSVEQSLEKRIQEKAAFLGEINIIGVDQQKAEILGLGTAKPAASRTDTTNADRAPRSLHDIKGRAYECFQTNFDTYVTYKELDAWAKFPNFQAMVRDVVVDQIARDRLMIGWNGTSAAPTTDIAANPLLQDVNVGWLKAIRTSAPERVLSGIKVGTGVGFDARTLDALVFDAVAALVEPWYQDDTALVAITGRELVSDKYLALLNDAATDAPTEKAAMNTLIANKTLGGKKSKLVPFFPARSILVTKASNLSIYYQNGTRRRFIQDNPKRDRVDDFQSVNEAYVVEDLGACALIDNILMWDGEAFV
jgi:P2 family phage major capsid protein